MDLDQLKQLLDLVRVHELSEFEIEHEGLRLKIRKEPAGPAPLVAPAPSASAAPAGVPPPPTAPAAVEPAKVVDESGIELEVVKSPIVGTFYRSSEPGTPSFVEIGTIVKKGDVLCIIEAMKLMNEIESEVRGRVVEILTENAQPVEFGQKLFLIDPA